jgi:hypothetical protein
MRKRIRLSRRIPIIALASLSVSWCAYAALQDNGFEGAFRFVQADSSQATATFETDDELSQYLVVGFDAKPLMFEVSDPFNAIEVVGYEHLTPEGAEDAVYFVYDVPGQFVAVQEDAIHAIDAIDSVR